MDNVIDWKILGESAEARYQYYLHLGYDEKTSVVLALYTYGSQVSRKIRIEELYRAITSGSGKGMSVSEAIRETVPPLKANVGNVFRSFGKSAVGGACICAAGGGVKNMAYSAMSASSARRESSVTACVDALTPMECYTETSVSDGCCEFATDEYESIEEKDALDSMLHPTSTFRMTTNTASAGILLNQLREGRRIDKNMVRIEEVMNYFHYTAEFPKDEMFALSYELMPGLDENKKMLYLHVQGKKEIEEKQNIVVLLDVSGSMCSNKVETQAALATIISKLKEGDKFSLVTYSNTDYVVIDSMPMDTYDQKVEALEVILELSIGGCTYGSRGIESAYKLGAKNYVEGGNNQIILITDGDLNFGITDKGGLEELIEEKKKSNLFLSVIGTGLDNYKDDKLEVLSKHGNGIYRVVNNLFDVQKSIDLEYESLVNVIAKDVKAQVEFNPGTVKSYRLLGFENRELKHEDFTNDAVISEPFGSGGYGVALYEIELGANNGEKSNLKYQTNILTDSKELGTLKIRYKEPLGDSSIEVSLIIPGCDESFGDNAKLAYIIYVCAEKLRNSDKISENDIARATAFCGELGDEIKLLNPELDKLTEILRQSKKELNVGIHAKENFRW